MSFKSILDNDFYKFTMQYAAVKLYPDTQAKYEFINRGKHEFPEGFGKALQERIHEMAQLVLTPEEKIYLKFTCPYLNSAYLDFLQGYRYDPAEVQIEQNGSDVSVKIHGYWYRTILWEVPILSLISELYYELTNQERDADEKVVETVKRKAESYQEMGVKVAEFGTRRRHSYAVHQLVVDALKDFGGISYVGTSNVHFAMTSGVKPIGTHAHEWFMYHGARFGFKVANGVSLDRWVNVYHGDLGIALTDTYTTEVFFTQFNKKLAKLFDGVRHDSGDPIEFAEKTIDHYKRMGIDPMHKTIIFSDGLNLEKVKSIAEATKDKIGISFGIGTNLTNDVGLQPMNIVLKLIAIAEPDIPWTNVVKLSDEKGKHTGDPRMIHLAKEILEID
ncbi:nicotinate phosphoribosyltransferase [Moheibacter lacus]|uniref:Nicotinate phosphoribosyltransferase n=1 Tax=Moheibacter lacus TaxID=2745851 RepID=A0A838ZU90_9FLAO|nr:nicotinate phosphoribosyltransferase [Moheibacter lacus]MBA5630522.1 nicotinate phosphoribosyltransferase [Moheibacter lacus]